MQGETEYVRVWHVFCYLQPNAAARILVIQKKLKPSDTE
jgi:hypothetical protein